MRVYWPCHIHLDLVACKVVTPNSALFLFCHLSAHACCLCHDVAHSGPHPFGISPGVFRLVNREIGGSVDVGRGSGFRGQGQRP